MKKNLESWVWAWFRDSSDYALNNYALCSEWLSDYVMNCDMEFVRDFFDDDNFIEEHTIGELRGMALDWIDENADDIVNFDDYR